MNAKDLPIWAIMPDMLETIRRGNNLVLTAPPGSGKTTQVPQALLDSNLCKGVVVVVQPRRIACRAAARRIAEERGMSPGGEVGYIVRYDRAISPATRLLFLTDGMLLRFLERDACLPWAGAVIFDEFHERRAMTDVALGLLVSAQQRRPSLRLLAMSATMESQRVTSFLDAETLSAEGRSYHVEISYSPAGLLEDALVAIPPRIASLNLDKNAGDTLVFLPGKAEIQYLEKAISTLKIPNLVVLPLHSELTREAQDRVFHPVIGRKVVLATNIAETSVTIPGIRTVIDTGYERRADFDPAFGINRLALTKVSKASADQRAGRAGRDAPGRCIRLWKREDHGALDDYTPVEMQRTDLSSIVMTLKSLDILDPCAFNFLDSPAPEQLGAAEELLVKLGAIGTDRRLTPTGWRMLRLPLPPRYGRMVVESERSGCLNDVANIAALMAGRSILAGKEGMSRDAVKVQFERDDSSDFFSLLGLYHAAREHRWSEDWCREHGINADALVEAVRLRRMITIIAKGRGTRRAHGGGSRASIRRCILTGLVDRIAQQEHKREYHLTNGLGCVLDASSVVRGRLLAAADLRDVPKRSQRRDVPTVQISFVTRIEPSMLEQVAPHLITIRRVPVAFDARHGQVTVREDTCYDEVLIRSLEKQAELVDAFPIFAEQRARAKKLGWHRVDVKLGINRKSHVFWGQEKVTVDANATGPHWAIVYGGNSPKIILRERIIVVPGMEDEQSPALPASLTERLQRLSPALATLLDKH